MNTSLKWIKDLVPGLDCTPQEYMDAMTLSGSKVEGYENMDEDLDKLESDPGSVRAKAYDIVLNGTELGGGSVRIHQDDIQEKMFEVLGFTKERAHEQFGFLLDAFSYGVPPHAGLAYGVDRMIMHMVHADSIRDVIAFPKVKDASDLMSEAPGSVDEKQLEELGIAIVKSEDSEE